MAQFLQQLVGYRRTALTFGVASVVPWLVDWLRDSVFQGGITWTWQQVGGPVMLGQALDWMATHPLPSLVVAAVVWVVLAATLSARDVRRSLQQPRTDLADWRAHEGRFEKTKGTVSALWSYFTESGELSWEIHRNDGASERDLQVFQAEAVAAGADLQRMKTPPQRFLLPSNAPSIDIWLNALSALVDPKSDWTIDGQLEGRRSVGGTIEDLGEASVVACKRLAAGDLQPSKRFLKTRCFNATKLVSDLDAEINTAVNAGYAERNRGSVDALMQAIGDWLSLHFGPQQRQLFLTAPPYPQVYSAVPAQFRAEWQVCVGRLMYLRELAKKWCDES